MLFFIAICIATHIAVILVNYITPPPNIFVCYTAYYVAAIAATPVSGGGWG